jgi:hypothetical protein
VLAVVSPATTVTAPPLPLFPLPTVTVTDPPRPAVAAPVVTDTAPVLPLLDVPDVKLNRPLIPDTPALTVDTVNAPLDVAKPYPVTREIAPPVETVL